MFSSSPMLQEESSCDQVPVADAEDKGRSLDLQEAREGRSSCLVLCRISVRWGLMTYAKIGMKKENQRLGRREEK